MSDKNNRDVFGILNEFAVSHGMISETGSYEGVGETIYQSDSVQSELAELVSDLYGALQFGYEERLKIVNESIEKGGDETAGFNSYEMAHILNDTLNDK